MTDVSEANYSRSGDYAEITLRDSTGRKLDTFKWPKGNKKIGAKIRSLMKDKYDYDWEPVIEEEEPEKTGFFTKEPQDFKW